MNKIQTQVDQLRSWIKAIQSIVSRLDYLESIDTSILDKISDTTSKLTKWVMMNDVRVQLTEKNATAGVGKEAEIIATVVDGDGTIDIFNTVSAITVEVIGGQIVGPATKTVSAGVVYRNSLPVNMEGGVATFKVTRTTPGNVTLKIKSATHPYVTLITTDSATVTFQ